MAKQVLVPPLGTTVDTVTLVSWYKTEGEVIRKGEPLFVIETDKANLDVESPASGILRGVTAVAGDELKALTVIAYIAEADEAVTTATPSKPAVVEQAAKSSVQTEIILAKERTGGRIFISPRARRLAEENHLPISQLKATGPEGAIIERDVRQYLQNQEASPISVTPPTPMAANVLVQQRVESRTEIAESMLPGMPSASYFTLSAEADITQLVAWRSKLLETNSKPTYNSLMLLIIGRVLETQPHLLPEFVEGTKEQSQQVDIGLAVVGNKRFLFPVIHNVSQKGLTQLAAEERELVTRATSGSLQAPTEDDCVLRLCNLGEFGIDTFTPWFYTPGCATLCVGRIKEQRDIIDGKVSTRQVVWLGLAADIRQMDGLPAAQFLQTLVRYLENPTLLIGL